MAATKNPKTETITVTGVIERCNQESRKPYRGDRYSQSERDEFYLDMCLRLDDGSAAYFTPKAAERTITMGGPFAVVLYWIDGEAANWQQETWPAGEEKRAIASAGVTNNNGLTPLVKVGDRITVTGRVKRRAVSKKGNPYVALTHVRKTEAV
jgi:hypothetical protein